jgi:ribosomal protein L44E
MSNPVLTLVCGGCLATVKVNRLIFTVRRKSGLPYPCEVCGEDLYELGEEPKKGKTNSQKRSRRQEKRAARRIGGKVQPASGAGQAKGDVRLAGHTRMECKFTRAKSYSLKLEELKKIEQEAGPGEQPVFEIEFQGVYPHERYVVLPGWLYDHLDSLQKGDE